MEVREWEKMVRENEGMSLSLAFPALMRKVYLWMTLALAISGVTAYIVATSPGLLQMVYGNRWGIWALIIAEFILVWKISGGVWNPNRSLAATTVMFAIFSALNGATLSSIFALFAPAAIIKTFMVTTATFAATAAYGYFTRRDMTKMGGLLMMALIGLIIKHVPALLDARHGREWRGCTHLCGPHGLGQPADQDATGRRTRYGREQPKDSTGRRTEPVSRFCQPLPVPAPLLGRRQRLRAMDTDKQKRAGY